MDIKLNINNRDQQLFLVLVLMTAFDALLLLFRLYKMNSIPEEIPKVGTLIQYRGYTFLFLAWNLFLAWIPYLMAMLLENKAKCGKSWWLLLPIFAGWLLFFPNAPYIVTDLLHLRHRPPLPLWYDLLLIFSFAWTGLMLGFLSLLKVHRVLDKVMGKTIGWTVVLISIALTGFGVYLGRFLRWNSWDVVTQPFALLKDIGTVLSQPLLYLNTFGLAIVLTAMLLLGYFMLLLLSAPLNLPSSSSIADNSFKTKSI